MIARTTYGQSRPWRAGARGSPRGDRSRSGAGEPGGDEEQDPDDDQQPEGASHQLGQDVHASFAAGRVSRSETSESTSSCRSGSQRRARAHRRRARSLRRLERLCACRSGATRRPRKRRGSERGAPRPASSRAGMRPGRCRAGRSAERRSGLRPRESCPRPARRCRCGRRPRGRSRGDRGSPRHPGSRPAVRRPRGPRRAWRATPRGDREQPLECRLLERPVDDLVRSLPAPAAATPDSDFQSCRLCLELGLDVDVEELVDGRRDGAADLVVVEQTRARVREDAVLSATRLTQTANTRAGAARPRRRSAPRKRCSVRASGGRARFRRRRSWRRSFVRLVPASRASRFTELKRRVERANARSTSLRAIRHETLIGDVEISRRLISCSASVRNIFAATPGCDRMPAPTREIFPSRDLVDLDRSDRLLGLVERPPRRRDVLLRHRERELRRLVPDVLEDRVDVDVLGRDRLEDGGGDSGPVGEAAQVEGPRPRRA